MNLVQFNLRKDWLLLNNYVSRPVARVSRALLWHMQALEDATVI